MKETHLRRFMHFAVLAIVVAAVGCTHTKATTADVKTAQAEAAAAAEKKDEAAKEQDRQKILAMKDITLADLYKEKQKVKDEIEKAPGYAVFDATGVFVVLYVGIEGRGVLIDNSNGEATYMTMARAGTGPGVGYERFRYVIVFKNKTLLDAFKTVGGDVGASGHLVARGYDMGGSVGAQMSFDPELSVYQITESGLAAEASWGVTAFVPDPFLNPKKPPPEPAKQQEPPAVKPAEKDTK
jgi:lipid-binding SYLF domain-containing protein